MRRSGMSHMTATATIGMRRHHGLNEGKRDCREVGDHRDDPLGVGPDGIEVAGPRRRFPPDRHLQEVVGARPRQAGSRRRRRSESVRGPSRPASWWRTGTSDSQNSRCRLAHSTPPLTAVDQLEARGGGCSSRCRGRRSSARRRAATRPSSSRSAWSVGSCGRVQLEHHDGDDDGQHGVAERLEPVGRHVGTVCSRCRRRCDAIE